MSTNKGSPLPKEVIKRLTNFSKFLTERGAEVLVPTNEYEIIRFRTGRGVSIIYRRKEDSIPCTMAGDSLQAWRGFLNPGDRWRAIPATKRQKPRAAEYILIRKRDGDDCFFCAEVVAIESETIEHLVPITCGGPQHISNKFLAHGDCNFKAGNISAPEKIAIYHKARIAKLQRGQNANG